MVDEREHSDCGAKRSERAASGRAVTGSATWQRKAI